ncbi:MAG: exo-alpha-sialidase [bacterium]
MKFALLFLLFFLIIPGYSRQEDSLIYWEPETLLVPGPSENFSPELTAQGHSLYLVWEVLDSVVKFMKTDDEGNTWTEPMIISDTLAGHRPHIKVWDNNIHCVWYTYTHSGGLDSTCYRKSTDQGATWDSIKFLGGTYHLTGIEVFADTIFVLRFITDTIPYVTYIIRSTDGGNTWSPPSYVVEVGFGWENPIVYNQGVLHVVVMTNLWQPDGIFYVRSTDLGETWSDTLRLSGLNCYLPKQPKIVKNDQGVLFVAWPDSRGAGWGDNIYLSKSTDNGITWSPEILVSNTGNVSHDHCFCTNNQNLYFVWPRSYQALDFRMSMDQGETWQNVETLCSNDLQGPTIASTFDKVHVIWHDMRIPNYHCFYYRRGIRSTGIQEQNPRETKYYFSVEPTVCQDKIVLTYNFSEELVNKAKILFVDASGSVIEKLSCGKGKNRIVYDTCKISPGVYFLVFQAGEKMQVKKIIIVK